MSIRRKLCIVLVCAAFAVPAVLLCLFPVEKYRFWPPCVFHKFTGLYCPGCGNTRALSALLHGRIGESLRNNLLLIPTLAVLTVAAARPGIGLNRFFAWGFAAVVILFFILRNIPVYPFTLLAPR